ncbi:hypothetical protein DSO57_1015628 [Entomophthora muscae]|uniref:Uncharacterized protein n=1 Tax=Entomophthora muscae TaxID=34485 RepID=A0ACC2U3P9_9FUNG|nr:hypothetical protein DSO57_1015628 [Entomophthora muscae]
MAQSINPRVQKLTRKYTKVTTTRTVNAVTTERVYFVYNPVYRCNGILVTIMEKVKPVLDTTHKNYVSDNKGEDEDKETQFYQTVDEKQVLKKIAAFYSKVPMSCDVAESMEFFPKAKKPKYHIIPDATWEAFSRLMKETTDYKKATSIVGISAKSAHRLCKSCERGGIK